METEEDVDRRRDEKTISKNGQRWTFTSLTRAAEDRTRWKGVVVKSSVVPQQPCKVMG